jgi:hypothetical protein
MIALRHSWATVLILALGAGDDKSGMQSRHAFSKSYLKCNYFISRLQPFMSRPENCSPTEGGFRMTLPNPRTRRAGI